MSHSVAIRLRLWLAAALPAVLAIVLLVAGFYERQGQALEDALHERGQASARQLAGAAEFMLFAGDQEGLSRLLHSTLEGDPLMRAVSILTPEGQIDVRDGVIGTKDVLTVRVPVQLTAVRGDELFKWVEAPTPGARAGLLGYAEVELSLHGVRQQQHELLVWALVSAVVGLLLAGVSSVWLASSVTAPLQHIAGVVWRLKEGRLQERADVALSGVLAPLATGINSMAEQVALTQDDLRDKVTQATGALRRQKELAEQAARTDALTGLLNRRAFMEKAEEALAHAVRYGHPLSLIMIDLDHFKRVNDEHGHAVGDAVLVGFARRMELQIRVVDVLARLGGEEFVLLLPNVALKDAGLLAERMRNALASSGFAWAGGELHCSASFGVAQLRAGDRVLSYWMARADAALYQAKAKGRNRVELAADDFPTDSGRQSLA